MNPDDNNQEATVTPEDTGEKVETNTEDNFVKVPKSDYEKMNQDLGSLKRELKEFKKPKEPKEETPTKNQTEEFGLLQKTYLRSAGITAEDEVELAKDIQKKTGMEWDKLVEDDYFQTKLEGLRTTKANAEATDVGEGGSSTSNAKNTPEYWIKKGTPPTAKDVPDRKTRNKITQAMVAKERDAGGKFYND